MRVGTVGESRAGSREGYVSPGQLGAEVGGRPSPPHLETPAPPLFLSYRASSLAINLENN